MKIDKITRKIALFLSATITLLSCDSNSMAQNATLNPNHDPLPNITTERKHPTKKIKLALLLDTSGSMEGLIEQTKSQLWSMVNELADARCDNLRPTLEIALYEYGNSKLNSHLGYIRMVTPLTENLDQLSEDLFALTTSGGSEHCGQAIYTSLNELEWSKSNEDLQVIFIAGNEPFTQGPISYRLACKQALQNKVTINTIYCGEFSEGINSMWKDGATRTGGDYMSINHNSRTVYIESPYDKDIARLNDQLNDTYISYGKKGQESKLKQAAQDKNANSYGLQNSVNRAITKSKHIYKNSEWDLVDAINEDEAVLESLEETEINEEMQGMSAPQRKQYVIKKSNERKVIQDKIAALGKKRKTFIAEQKRENSDEQRLDNAMLSAITKQAAAKRFEF